MCAGIAGRRFAAGEQTWKILIGGGIIAAVLSIIPRLYVWYRRRVRLAQINGGLADMLDMLSMCLGGGMSISASLDHVAKNLASYPALAEELQIMRRQTDVGSLRMALADWANRIDTPEVRQVATLLTRGDSLGTSLSGSLLDQADHFRTARKQLATLQANRMPVLPHVPAAVLLCPGRADHPDVAGVPAVLRIPQSAKTRNNPLANNETISTERIANQIGGLDQNMPALRRQRRRKLNSPIGSELTM